MLTQPIQTKKEKNSVLGSATGVAVGLVVPKSMGFIKNKGYEKIFAKLGNNSPQVNSDIFEGVIRAMKDSGIEKEGYKIIHIKDPKCSQKLIDSIKNSYLKKYKIKKISDFLANRTIKKINKSNTQIFEGINAGCNTIHKSIIMPKGKLAQAGFHEIGHAINSTSKNSKNIYKLKKALLGKFRISIPLFLLFFGALTKNTKPKEGEDLNFLQKTKNFIRNNIGKLTFIAYTPLLLEEGLASIRGQKLAKKALAQRPELIKKVAKNNIVGFSSYLTTALLISFTNFLTVKVKDKIQEKKNQKIQLNT